MALSQPYQQRLASSNSHVLTVGHSDAAAFLGYGLSIDFEFHTRDFFVRLY